MIFEIFCHCYTKKCNSWLTFRDEVYKRYVSVNTGIPLKLWGEEHENQVACGVQ
jgi:hypothetical protein